MRFFQLHVNEKDYVMRIFVSRASCVSFATGSLSSASNNRSGFSFRRCARGLMVYVVNNTTALSSLPLEDPQNPLLHLLEKETHSPGLVVILIYLSTVLVVERNG